MKKIMGAIANKVKDPFGYNRRINSMTSEFHDIALNVAQSVVEEETRELVDDRMSDMVYDYNLVTSDNIHDELTSGYNSVVYEDDIGDHISTYLGGNTEQIESIVDDYCDDTYVTVDEVRDLVKDINIKDIDFSEHELVMTLVGDILSNDDMTTAIRNMVADMIGEIIENMRVQITDYRGEMFRLSDPR
tara:strand:+ start:2693 stop:3259 length:567 start_codon:yes stop_codon:yes gene_type:complete